MKLFPNLTSISFNYFLIAWVTFLAKRYHSNFAGIWNFLNSRWNLAPKIRRNQCHARYSWGYSFFSPIVEKGLFAIFLDSRLKSYDFVGGLISKNQDFMWEARKGLAFREVIRLLLAMDTYQLTLKRLLFMRKYSSLLHDKLSKPPEKSFAVR